MLLYLRCPSDPCRRPWDRTGTAATQPQPQPTNPELDAQSRRHRFRFFKVSDLLMSTVLLLFGFSPIVTSDALYTVSSAKSASILSFEETQTVCYPLNIRKIRITATTTKNIQMFEFQAFSSGTNVALGKTAIQSTTLSNLNAEKAVDGNVDTVSHTADTSAFWEVDLNKDYSIQSVVILNMWCGNPADTNGCLCHLSEAIISLLDSDNSVIDTMSLGDTCAQPEITLSFAIPCPTSPPPLSLANPKISPIPSPKNACYTGVRKVRLESSTQGVNNMFELQVFSSGTNVALGKAMNQFSTLSNSNAAYATDKNLATYPQTTVANTITIWEVDLGWLYTIDSVVILNKWCGSGSDPNQPTSAKLILLDQWNAVIAKRIIGDTCHVLNVTIPFVSNPSCPTIPIAKSPTRARLLETSNSPSASTTSSPCYTGVRKVRLASITSDNIMIYQMQVIASGTDVALGKTAIQSSTLSNFSATRAVDASIGTYSHTNEVNSSSFWEVDLGSPYSIEYVTIVNQWCGSAGDPSRSSSAKLTLLDQLDSVIAESMLGGMCNALSLETTFVANLACHTLSPTKNPSRSPSSSPSKSPSVSPTSSPTIGCYAGVQKVRFESTTLDNIMIYELQVFSSGTDVAMGKTANQSSTLFNFNASRAIDANTGTYSHTNEVNTSGFWEVDLGGLYFVDYVVIVNQWCGSGGDPSRNSSAMLTLLNQSNSVIGKSMLGGMCNTLSLETTFVSNLACLTKSPTKSPSRSPSTSPSISPSMSPSMSPSAAPSRSPSASPSTSPTTSPSLSPSLSPSVSPSTSPSMSPSTSPSRSPSASPSKSPTISPSLSPSLSPSVSPSTSPSMSPSVSPSKSPSAPPSMSPSASPSVSPSASPSVSPSSSPSVPPSSSPSMSPTQSPSTSCFARRIKLQSAATSPIAIFELQAFSNGLNSALGKFANQSSTLNNNQNFKASNAVDGVNSTFSHTASATLRPWWYVDLNETIVVQSVTILNRWCVNAADPTNCLCRLSNATLSFLDENGSTVASRTIGNTCKSYLITKQFCLFSIPSPSVQPSESPTKYPSRMPSRSPSKLPSKRPTAFPTISPSSSPSTPCFARRIKLQSAASSPIAIFELQAFSNGLNSALGKFANQSSTLNYNQNFKASNAVDGVNSTFSHTASATLKPWWYVDLNETIVVQSVTILNRWCVNAADLTGCLCRLTNATLSFLDENGATVASRTIGNTCNVSVVSFGFCT